MYCIFILLISLVNIKSDVFGNSALPKDLNNLNSNSTAQKRKRLSEDEWNKIIKKARLDLLSRDWKEILEPDITNELLADPIKAVKYARAKAEQRKARERKSKQNRTRRESETFSQPKQHFKLREPTDVTFRGNDDLILETLPKDLINLQIDSFAHVRLCLKPVIPEEVNTDRKIKFPFKGCTAIEEGGTVFIDENFPVPWMYRIFHENECILLKENGNIWYRYYPVKRRFENFLSSNVRAYTHKSNRSAILSIMIDDAFMGKKLELSVEGESSVSAPLRFRRNIDSKNSPDEGYFTIGSVRVQPKQAALFNLYPQTYDLPEAINFITNDTGVVVFYGGEASEDSKLRRGLWDLSTENQQSSTPIEADNGYSSYDNPAQIALSIETSLKEPIIGHSNIDKNRKVLKRAYILQSIKQNSKITVLRMGQSMSLNCFSEVKYTKKLRILYDQRVFRGLKKNIRKGRNSISLILILDPIAQTMNWQENKFTKIGDDLFLTNLTEISRVTCGDLSDTLPINKMNIGIQPQSQYFIVMSEVDYASFINFHWSISTTISDGNLTVKATEFRPFYMQKSKLRFYLPITVITLLFLLPIILITIICVVHQSKVMKTELDELDTKKQMIKRKKISKKSIQFQKDLMQRNLHEIHEINRT